MTETKTIPCKIEDHLETPEDIAAYLEAVFEHDDPQLISHALGAVARSKGMTEIAGRHRIGSAEPVQGPLARGSAPNSKPC